MKIKWYMYVQNIDITMKKLEETMGKKPNCHFEMIKKMTKFDIS